LEASPDDIEVIGAEYRVKGSPDKVKTLQEIAFALDLAFDAPEGMEPYLDETAYHDTPNCTFPFGTHIAVVEIDEETGKVDLVRYLAVDDVGKKINPMIVDGQLHGGIAQGVGQAGTIASTAAVANAVNDALGPLGITHLDMPYTAQTVWTAIQAAKGGQA